MGLTPSFTADWLIVATLALMAGHALFLKSRGRLQLIDPLFAFWAGFFICNIQQPLAHARRLMDWHPAGVFEATLAFSLLGAACVVAGYEHGWGQRLALKLYRFPARLRPGRLFLAGLGLFGLSLLGYHYLFESAGGAWEWLAWGRGGTDYDRVSGYVAELEKFLPLGLFLILIHCEMHGVPAFKRALAWALMAAMAWWYLYLGTRSRLILAVTLAAAAYYLPRRKSPPLAGALAAFLALFILARFQEHYRQSFTHLSFHLEDLDMAEAKARCLPAFLGGDPEGQSGSLTKGVDFNVAMSVVELVPGRVPYNRGWGFFEFLTRPIPRSLWPDKIYPGLESWQGVLREGALSTARARDRDLLVGPAFTFVAFYYYILGPLALLAGGFYTGVLLRCIRGVYDREPGNQGDLIIYVCLISIGFNEAAATPFNWVFDVPIVVFLPLGLLLTLCGAPPRPLRRPA